MEKERAKARLLKILEAEPELKSILVSADTLENKRGKTFDYLSALLAATFEYDPTLPALEWVMVRDAIVVFRNMLSVRNESLAGFSLLAYLNDLVNRPAGKQVPPATAGFLAEMEHLLKAISGRAQIYVEKPPAFLKYDGGKAARLRSVDLGHMARASQKFMARYPYGLDSSAVRRRSRNKNRILNYFGATDLEWERWNWHTRNIIRDADTLGELVELTPDEYRAVMLARQHKIPFGITPYYLSLMDREGDRRNDYAVRAQVIPSLHYIETIIAHQQDPDASMDFMLERDTTPIEGITRRYPMIVILKPIMTCPQICVYCQRNWEIEDVYSSRAVLPRAKLDRALQWIADHPEVIEVLVTGGDPFFLSNAKIEDLLFKLSRIKHVARIRLGTRTPVTLPQRITDSLVRDIAHFHDPGRREVLIVTHFEHPYEITPQSMAAVQKFRRAGMKVYNQLVYTFYNSRKFEASLLRHRLHMIGVTPYYTFNTKGKEETDDFRVPIARLLQEQKEEARLLPGVVRTDRVVFNVPRLGKNYLDARQHHDLISILPDGRRVYEFHPWEKKLSLVDTYIHTDVAIYDYLKKLRAAGEDTRQYNTIWYYY